MSKIQSASNLVTKTRIIINMSASFGSRSLDYTEDSFYCSGKRRPFAADHALAVRRENICIWTKKWTNSYFSKPGLQKYNSQLTKLHNVSGLIFLPSPSLYASLLSSNLSTSLSLLETSLFSWS